ncbi:hypothetical protein BJV82DRAFT_237396 [Fennellomyces sp. T-0311]|nr:hypothetical protein BJV82DRAFT_237396 [Fennellomyces sp. T-0311]
MDIDQTNGSNDTGTNRNAIILGCSIGFGAYYLIICLFVAYDQSNQRVENAAAGKPVARYIFSLLWTSLLTAISLPLLLLACVSTCCFWCQIWVSRKHELPSSEEQYRIG